MVAPYPVTVTEKECRRCGTTKVAADFPMDAKMRDGVNSYCIACHRAAARSTHKERYVPVTLTHRECRCGRRFLASGGRIYCGTDCAKTGLNARQREKLDHPCPECGMERAWRSKYCRPCSARVDRDRERAARHMRRARMKNVPRERVVAIRVYARDEWRCGICREPVDPVLTYPHLESASLDHVVPLSRGGTHTYSNTQLAHLSCNLRKGADVYADAYAPIVVHTTEPKEAGFLGEAIL